MAKPKEFLFFDVTMVAVWNPYLVSRSVNFKELPIFIFVPTPISQLSLKPLNLCL